MFSLEKIKQGLARTREQLGKPITQLFKSGNINDAFYEELETILLTADAGVQASTQLLNDLKKRVKRDGLTDAAQLKEALQEALIALLAPLAQTLDTSTKKPFVIMLVGVNGAGKTTSIGQAEARVRIANIRRYLATTPRCSAAPTAAMYGQHYRPDAQSRRR